MGSPVLHRFALLALATGAGERMDVIVVFRSGTSGTDGATRVRAVAADARLSRTFHLIPAVAGALTPADIVAVAALEEVRQIELDRVGAPELGTATEVMGADAAVDTLGISGDLDGVASSVSATDVGVAVLDTGFHTSHQELAGSKLVAWYDPATGATQPSDTEGHGTHVANIAVGWGASPQHRGVAPGASLIGVRISGGGNTASNAIAGYEWIVDHMAEFNIRVATIEMGAEVFTATFEVAEGAGAFPIAASILTDGTLLYAEILRPDGSARVPAGAAPINTADRQHNYSFFPVQPGTYTLRAIATPGSTITADISHP